VEAADLECRIPHSIVLVHGTYAQRLSDQGDAWWQLGSKFSERVRKALKGLGIPSDECFHWSGENSDAFRVFDSSLLLERLRRENDKGPFHVVAHSHGGMVLWHALMLSVERQISLNNLQSWMTVGTPDLTSALVHCLYFEVESCQQLIAAALRHVCGGNVNRTHEDWTKQAHAAALKMVEIS
jgi:hypothetical protein